MNKYNGDTTLAAFGPAMFEKQNEERRAELVTCDRGHHPIVWSWWDSPRCPICEALGVAWRVMEQAAESANGETIPELEGRIEKMDQQVYEAKCALEELLTDDLWKEQQETAKSVDRVLLMLETMLDHI